MHWVQTYTGRKFFPLAPRVEDVDIRDIAHALAFNCRFNGHCLRFYSVAEHSVRVSLAVPEAQALWGLLHDAAEAYLTDLPRPVKIQMPAFSEFEDRLLETILGKFGLSMPMPSQVKYADDALLATEQRDVMAPPPDAWHLPAPPLPDRIEPMPPQVAERAFLERFDRLTKLP